MKKQSILAGIVTYNPDIFRLNENINAIIPQVEKVLIFDNGSENLMEILRGIPAQCILLNPDNKNNNGIAYALNSLLKYAYDNGYGWVLTLDQDSVCPANIISAYSRYLEDSSIGMISPIIVDRNCGCLEKPGLSDISEIDTCITSASLLRVDVWKSVNGFWDDLFIDMVDIDMCWSIRDIGMRVIRVNSVKILHELGHSQAKSFRGKEVAIFNHRPQRYYYIIRNSFLVGRKHHRLKQCMRWNLKRIYLVLRYETDRLAKIKMIALGVMDGIRGKSGPLCVI